MKKALYIALALVISLSLASCGNSDADRSDNTKDGVLGDGFEEDMDKLKDDIRDAGNDITNGGNVGGGTQDGSTKDNNTSTGTNGTNGTNDTGTTGGVPGTSGMGGANGTGTETPRTTLPGSYNSRGIHNDLAR